MIGLSSPRKDYFYKAKWISNDDRKKYAFFNFRIVSDDNTLEADLDRMSGTTGTAVWETMSAIDFQPEDIIIFRGQKFHVKVVDGNRKADVRQENSFYYVRNNGGLVTRLQVRKAG